MNTIKSAINYLSRYFDISFFVKFILLLIALKYFNLFYLGITAPGGGLYSPFLDRYLNYISWDRSSVLHTSNIIAHVLGLNSYIIAPNDLRVHHGGAVTLLIPCLGLGMMSFWVAFVTANTGYWRKKLYWCLAGIIAIWFINCWRVALLLLAIEKGWKVNEWDAGNYIDHHTLYNLLAYSLIIFLVYLFYRQNKKEMYNEMATRKIAGEKMMSS